MQINDSYKVDNNEKCLEWRSTLLTKLLEIDNVLLVYIVTLILTPLIFIPINFIRFFIIFLKI